GAVHAAHPADVGLQRHPRHRHRRRDHLRVAGPDDRWLRTRLRGRVLRRDERGGRLQPDRPDAADVPQAATASRFRPAGEEVMNAASIAVALAYLRAAAGFVVALHLMNSPATARRGSRLSWLGMIVAVAAALTSVIHEATITTTGWIVLGTGAAGGAMA